MRTSRLIPAVLAALTLAACGGPKAVSTVSPAQTSTTRPTEAAVVASPLPPTAMPEPTETSPTAPTPQPSRQRAPYERVVQGTGNFPRLPVVAAGADGITLVLYLVEGDTATQLVTFEGLDWGSDSVIVRLSPDGKHIAALLLDSWDGASTLEVVDVASAGRLALDRGAGDLAPEKGAAHESVTDLAWLDDEHVLYSKVTSPSSAQWVASWETGTPPPIQGEVWLSSLDGKEQRLLASGRIHRVLGASPDGQTVYVTRFIPGREAEREEGFALVELASGELRNLWPQEERGVERYHSFTLIALPGGTQRLLFATADRVDTASDTPPVIWMADMESGQAEAIWTIDRGNDWSWGEKSGTIYDIPRDFLWSPQSEREVIYLAHGAGLGHVWRVDLGAGMAAPLSATEAQGSAGLLAWTSEGIVIQNQDALWLLDEGGEVQGEIRFREETALVSTLTPTPSPTAMPPPRATPLPVATPARTSSPQSYPVIPARTPSPRPYPVPGWTPYEDAPFTIVFMRDGELWMSEIGGRGEWQLTHEGPDWAAGEFAISPDGQYIAFITWDQTATSPRSENQCVKLVHVPDESTQALTSPDDLFDEFNLTWWDARHVTFQVRPREGLLDTELSLYTIVVTDVETGERTFEPASAPQSRSPDGKYLLVGDVTALRPTSKPYWLHHRATGEQWMVAGEDEHARFLGWSPDSRWILFGLSREGEGPDTLFSVDVETRSRRVLTPAGRTVCGVAAWSPDSRAIAYFQCGPHTCGGANCELWLIAPDGSNQRTVPVSVSDFYLERMAWTPDGSRLVFNEALHNPLPEANYNYIWSVRVDGVDLRQVAIGHRPEFQVLSMPSRSAKTPTPRQKPPSQVLEGYGGFPRLPVIAPGSDGTLALYLVEGDRAARLVEFQGLNVDGDSVIARLSPNGQYIAALLLDSWDGASTLEVVDVASTIRLTLDRGAGDLTPEKRAPLEAITSLAWLDDEHILYSKETKPSTKESDTSQEIGTPLPVRGEIWLTDLAGNNWRLAEAPVYRVLGAAPDGQHVYCTCDRDLEWGAAGARGDAFCVLDVASGAINMLWPSADNPLEGSSPLNDTFFGYQLVAMPDGTQRVLFVGIKGRDGPPANPPDIWLGDPESGEAEHIWTVNKSKPFPGDGAVYDVPVGFLWSPQSEREFVYRTSGVVLGGLWWVDVEAERSGNVAAGDLQPVAWRPEGIVIQERGLISLLDKEGKVQGKIHLPLGPILAS